LPGQIPHQRSEGAIRRREHRQVGIGVAGGRSKARAIAGALRGRLVSGLITDEAAARRILDLRIDPL